MKEYKLIPLNDVNVSTTNVCSNDDQSSSLKNMDEPLKVGGDGFKDHIIDLLTNKEMDNHFKIILLNYISQKMDNKMKFDEKIVEKKSREDEKMVMDTNLFDVIKNDILPADIPNAYRMFTYFIDKNDIRWDDNGIIKINGNKIGMDIYKLFKYLT